MELNIKDYSKLTELPMTGVHNLLRELTHQIDEVLENSTDDIDYCVFRIEGKNYSLSEVDSEDWDDQGKFQTSSSTYQVVVLKEDCSSWHSEKDEIEQLALFCDIGVTRTGTYYQGYEYEYDSPYFYRAVLKHVPEQIIPAHEEVVLTTDFSF